MRVRLISLLLFASFAYAHSGFDTLAWQERLGAYTATVLADFHVANGGQLFMQLSEGREAAPDGTKVSAIIRLQDRLVYEGDVPFAARGSADGQSFYRAYALDLPLQGGGVYKFDLNVSGPLGAAQASYIVQAQRGTSVLEYLPSVVILLITLGGATLLFIPLKRKDTPHETSASKPFRAHES